MCGSDWEYVEMCESTIKSLEFLSDFKKLFRAFSLLNVRLENLRMTAPVLTEGSGALFTFGVINSRFW